MPAWPYAAPQFAMSTHYAEAFVELAGVSGLFKFCQHMRAVLGVNELLVGGGTFYQ